MPVISMFYGIVIRMYFDEHNPPHFHAKYQDFEGVFSLDGDQSFGDMPVKQQKLIAAWVQLHRDELEANWELMRNSENPYRITPLH